MKAVWVDAGNNPDYAKLAKYHIRAPYFDPRDPRITAAYLDSVKDRPEVDTCGLYFAWNWYPQLNGAQFAEKIHAELLRIAWHGNAPVCINIEKGGLGDDRYVPYVVDCLTRWRKLRPSRQTDYTLEGFQGGLFSPRAVDQISATNVGIAPQFYAGDMTPLVHGVTLDLLLAGFPGDQMIGMYDAAALPWRWTGYAFTQGRLP